MYSNDEDTKRKYELLTQVWNEMVFFFSAGLESLGEHYRNLESSGRDFAIEMLLIFCGSQIPATVFDFGKRRMGCRVLFQ